MHGYIFLLKKIQLNRVVSFFKREIPISFKTNVANLVTLKLNKNDFLLWET